MQSMFAPTAREVVELIKEVVDRGHVVILPAPDRLHHVDRALRNKTKPPLVVACRSRFKLSPAESRAFVKLLEHDHVTREDLHGAMSRGGDPATGSKIIDVVVSKMRRKLVAYGIVIETIHGLGFKLAEETRDRARTLLGEHGESVPSTATPSIDQADHGEAAAKRPSRPKPQPEAVCDLEPDASAS